MTQWNARRGPALSPGSRFRGLMAPLPWPERIEPTTWYALAWSGLFDQAVAYAGPVLRDVSGLPVQRDVRVDRKYVPTNDLHSAVGDNTYVSERFARALLELGASGVTFEPAAHVTPHAASGHQVLRVVARGWLGPLVSEASPKSPTSPGTPILPMRIDASGWNGLDVCVTPWFGLMRPEWRALLMPGDLLSAVVERLPDLGCGLVPVELDGLSARRAQRDPGLPLDTGPMPRPVPLDATLAAIEGRGARHLLPRGAQDDTLQALSREAPFRLPDAYPRLLRRWDGLLLYRTDWNPEAGALFIWPSGERRARAVDWLEATNAVAMDGVDARVRSGEWFALGEDVQGNLLWCLDARGCVHGVGKEGIIYGPDTPFETWLGDMVRDMDWAADHPDAPGAKRLLANAPRS